MSSRILFFSPLLALMLSGCLAKTALDVATLPVKAVSKGVDLATTSQAEADQKRGRELRRREEELGKLQRQYDKLQAECLKGNERSCAQQAAVRGQIDLLLPTLPAEPR